MLGYDGTHYYVVRVDGQGNLRLAPGGVNLRQYNSVYRWRDSGAAGAGDISVVSPAVAAGRLLVVVSALVYVVAGSATALGVTLFSGGVSYLLERVSPVVLGAGCSWRGLCVLAPGDQLAGTAYGVGAGTTMWVYLVGYYVQ